MNSRGAGCAGAAALLAAIFGTPLVAQTPGTWAKAAEKALPRTVDGHADLGGIWSTAVLTPLERPAEFAGKPTIGDKEAAAWEKKRLYELSWDSPDAGEAGRLNRTILRDPDLAIRLGAYNDVWTERGAELARVDGLKRTSLVIDPPDGKIPPLTAEGQKRAAISRRQAEAEEGGGGGNLSTDDYKQLPLSMRCLMNGGGPPMRGGGSYNNNHQIVQTPNAVMIMTEMAHDVRVIHLDRSSHIAADVRQWHGDSIGHWEGDTLVAETTNFTDQTGFQGSDQNLKIIERFRRVDANTILYRATIDDPTVFTKPWTLEMPFVATAGPIFEYACHEGNYSIPIILGGKLAEPEK